MNRILSAGAMLWLLIAAGCGGSGPAQSAAVAPAKPVAKAEAPPPVETPKKPAAPPRPKQREVARAEEQAMKRVTTAIRESIELGPTLVVWLIDATPSAHDIVHEVSQAAANLYESPEASEWSAHADKPLLTAVATFDASVEFLLDPPTSDAKKAIEAFDTIRSSSGGHAVTFAAIKQSLEKYLPVRTRERREVLFVVVTDKAGDDSKTVDEVIEPVRKQAIPIYCIGLPAPWGQTNPFAANRKEPSKDDKFPTVGPESLLSERVEIDHWNSQNFTGTHTDLVDSGFGPFALERLCRASKGQFFALRPGQGYGYRAVSALTWPNGKELRFDESVVSRYAPDYVSEAEYRKLLADNKAYAALVAAAQVPAVKMEGQPGSLFAKADEAKMAKTLSGAQQFAARNLPPVEHLLDMLVKGEPDRAKVTHPRWQAEFDLAAGRVMAAKARLDGYNSMIAALKRGKTFKDPESKSWKLVSADNFETESTIKKMADKAKGYLERVMTEHPKTPWATIAEEELKLPLGWAWEESKDGGPPEPKGKKKGK
jgi:von Willebrand factor type A domain-containing protein